MSREQDKNAEIMVRAKKENIRTEERNLMAEAKQG